ncbi:conjugal transfer protein TraN [Pseudoalteromonas sp. SR45-4]|uniref:conjugal transfer protein TraN n=1 Tax=Pseudoalteromonas sp. SR45-4 TaxID=2760929 RepID=UPI0015F9C6A0|nr:conjugal transfer protein TraN [Pseudoalteromonas sp. SR45-4]MBB1372624.1 conjugal transfer protein TraN [Pseudoalteromonas sp. SR45-4]
MFKQIVSWVVLVIYSANFTSAAFAGLLLSMVSVNSAHAAPSKPVQMVYNCPDNMNLVAGVCLKTELAPQIANCEAGFIKKPGDEFCSRIEKKNKLPLCGDGYSYNSSYFPSLCYAETDANKYGSCPATYPEQIGAKCYKTQPPKSWNCPLDGPEAEPQTIVLECRGMAKDTGACTENETVTTPDQRWKSTSETMCQRTLWSGVNYSCPVGFTMEGDGCKKVSKATPTKSCPTGHYQNGNQCFPGQPKSCPAGSTIRHGVCHAPDGSLSCPSGMYLDTGSNLCVDNRSEFDPANWTTDDFDYFYEQGANLGNLIADNTTAPDSTGGGNINMAPPAFLNAEVTTANPDFYNNISAGGIDANNPFPTPTNTYQDEGNQSTFIEEHVKANKEFLDNQENVPGATSEEQVDNTNHSAVAYGSIMNSQNVNPPRKVSADSAMFQVSKNAVGDAFSGQGAYFGDCSNDTVTYTELDESKIITREETCFKPNKNNFSGCIVERELIKPNLYILEGAEDARITQCGDDCLELTLGKEEDDYLFQENSCGIYEKKIVLGLASGFAVTDATLTRTHYDDHFRLYADDEIIFDGVHQNFPTPDGFPTTHMKCEGKTSRDTYDHRNVTSQFQKAFNGDNRIEFTYKVAVGGAGEAYGKVRVTFDKPIRSSWEEEINYLPEGCNDALSDPQTFCTADEFQCDRSIEWTPIDLTTWSSTDSNGLWEIQEDPNDVIQRWNGAPTTFSSDLEYKYNSFKGFITVQTKEDDDFIGFVFGVPPKEVDLSNTNNSHYLLSWKKKGQKGAQSGIVLAEVSIALEQIPWAHQTNAPGYKVLGTSLGEGWERWKEYEFQLDIQPDKFTLTIDGVEKLSVDGEFNQGRIGFYNNSQEDVKYSKIQQLYPEGLGGDIQHIFKPLWPGADDLPICVEAHRPNYICDPLKGKKLSIDGGSFGFKDIISMDDACKPLDQDDQCDAISQECVPGWLDEGSNTCYAWDVKYQCQDTSNAVVTVVRENNTCMADTSCIDGNCDVIADETNGDFINALTTYATMGEMGDTKNCTVATDPSTCQVFSGEARWCGWDQLKVNDCCKQPAGVGMLDVFTLGQQMYTATGYAASAEGAFGGTPLQKGLQSAGEAVEGAWESFKEPIVDAAKSAWNAVSSKFTGAVSNTAGNVTGDLLGQAGEMLGNFKSSITSALSNFKDTILQKIYEMLPQGLQTAIQSAATAVGGAAAGSAGSGAAGGGAAGGGAAAGQAGAQVGAQALNTIGASVMKAASFIGMAYAVYQLAKLAYTLLTACEPEEEDMGVELLGKKCFFTHHVPCKKTLGVCTNRAKNFYCCYESVISRIIMEQAIDQLGIEKQEFRDTMGCRGLTIAELGLIDFSKIDFTEWIDMMAQSDQLPIDRDMVDVTGSNISNGFDRVDALERNKQRAPDNNWVDRRNEMDKGDVGNNVNCNTRPRPKSCDQGVY